jgi:excisionase family DNA binding protein
MLFPQLNDVPVTAKILGIKESTVRAWIHTGRIEFVRIGRRVKIPGAEIRRIIDEGRQPRQPVEGNDQGLKMKRRRMKTKTDLRKEAKRLVSGLPNSKAIKSIVRNIWNHLADEYNQWDSLGQDEKDELIEIASNTEEKK